MGGYQVEGEPAIMETQFGGTCETTVDAEACMQAADAGACMQAADAGSTYTTTYGDGNVYFQEFTRYQDVEGNDNTVGTVGEPKMTLFWFALVCHAWLLLVLATRIYQWAGCAAAQDYRSGGYMRFCVQLEKTKAHMWLVRLSFLSFIVAAGVGFYLSLTGNQRLTSQISNFLVLFFALYKLYSTPDVVVDLDHGSFSGVVFKAQPLWLLGIDGIVTKLGPLVATHNDEKLADYVSELRAGDMVLIGPPTEGRQGVNMQPGAGGP